MATPVADCALRMGLPATTAVCEPASTGAPYTWEFQVIRPDVLIDPECRRSRLWIVGVHAPAVEGVIGL